MRPLTGEELERVAYSTRQLFNFYKPDTEYGETVSHEGVEQRRGVRCHKLVYRYPDGPSTTRYFSVSDGGLVTTVTDKGVEVVEVGARYEAGIRFPERTDYYQGGQKLHSMVLADLEVNKPLPSGIFTIPKAGPKN